MFKQWAMASALATAGFSVQAAAVAPGGDLGALGGDAELFAAVLAGPATTFSHSFLFSLDGLSDVKGSVAELWGPVSFTSVMLNNSDSATLQPTNTGYGFSFDDLAAGNYTLTVSGSVGAGFTGYTGSILAQPVPEPQTVAMLLAGLGVMGAAAARRRKPH